MLCVWVCGALRHGRGGWKDKPGCWRLPAGLSLSPWLRSPSYPNPAAGPPSQPAAEGAAPPTCHLCYRFSAKNPTVLGDSSIPSGRNRRVAPSVDSHQLPPSPGLHNSMAAGMEEGTRESLGLWPGWRLALGDRSRICPSSDFSKFSVSANNWPMPCFFQPGPGPWLLAHTTLSSNPTSKKQPLPTVGCVYL